MTGFVLFLTLYILDDEVEDLVRIISDRLVTDAQGDAAWYYLPTYD